MTLTISQEKAVTDFLEFANIPRLRKILMSKFFKELSTNKDALSTEEIDDIFMLYSLLDSEILQR